MVVFKPCDAAQARAVFDARALAYDAASCYAYYTELGGVCYYCLFTVADTRAELLDLDFGAGAVIAEGLLRAALNFAAGESAYAVSCRRPSLDAFLLRFGFRREGACVTGEIPEILTGSCRGCSGH